MRKLFKITLCALGLVLATAGTASAQSGALKTNLLYAGYTQTPNLALELGLGAKSSLDLSFGYNPWNLNGDYGDNKKWVHLYIQPEYRWWTCERFNGHFFGAHALFTHFNVSEIGMSHFGGKLFEKDYRYEGYGYGAGISYGYHWVWSKRWAMEFQVGVGAAWLDYDKLECDKCGGQQDHESKWYFGPTKASISLVFHLW